MLPVKKTYGRRVKSGCLTCKARKVKCDEAVPVCNRCKTTGRTCDGYGVWGGGGNTYADRYPTTWDKYMVCISPKPCPSSKVSHDEGKYMQWLDGMIMSETSTFFDKTSWANLVMPAAWSVPAVGHALVALGAAQRGVMTRRQGLPDTQQQFTLRQYTKAIQLLQPLLAGRDGYSTTLVLVVCLLFTILEYTREQYRAAAVHLHNGLNLIKSLLSDGADRTKGIVLPRPALYNRAIHRPIFRVFASMNVQANLFGNYVHDGPLVLQMPDEEIPTPIFASLDDARDSLENLLHDILILKRRVEAAFATSGHLSLSLIESRRVGLCRLRTWQATYEATVERLPESEALNLLAYKIMLNFHAMAKIICTCMFSTSELVYNDHVSDFVAIVRRSVEVWIRHVLLRRTASSSILSIEIGWIPPLYYTALKCRVPRIRLHAIKLLKCVQQKEAVWDSTVAAGIAEKVTMLEAGHIENSPMAAFALDEVPNLADIGTETVISEANLFYEVQAEVLESSTLMLVCKKRKHLQQPTEVKCYFDGTKWRDLAPSPALPNTNTGL